MLNKEQKLAIQILEGPVRIVAGAGTGKTNTLIERIRILLEHNEKILVLTFTNKAAREIKKRLNEKTVHVLTFHSLAARLLRKFWKRDFTINDSDDPETLDFDQLLTKLLEIFEDQEILRLCQNLYTHILIDEYQDVNDTQVEITRRLAQKHQNICVVGDPDQTIYSWRGANVKTMDRFAQIYQNAKTIILKQNYRNPEPILKAAEELIPKGLEAVRRHSQPIQLWTSKDKWEETEILFHILEQILGSHSHMIDADTLDKNLEEFCFEDIAIIYRTQEQGKHISQILEKRGYPCQMSAPDSFWEKSEIKQFYEELKPLLGLDPSRQLFNEWLHKRINDFLEAQKFTQIKQARVKSLLAYAFHCQNLQEFIDEYHTNIDADNITKTNSINLLTFHAAKGLEFPIVIIPSLEDDLIPHKNSRADSYMLDEERRLLYVGMTRASQYLHLIKPMKSPSRFLQDIKTFDIARLPEARAGLLKKRKLKKAQMTLFNS